MEEAEAMVAAEAEAMVVEEEAAEAEEAAAAAVVEAAAAVVVEAAEAAEMSTHRRSTEEQLTIVDSGTPSAGFCSDHSSTQQRSKGRLRYYWHNCSDHLTTPWRCSIRILYCLQP